MILSHFCAGKAAMDSDSIATNYNAVSAEKGRNQSFKLIENTP
jgi:hypothetical protein